MTQVAHILLGSPPVLTSTSLELRERFILPNTVPSSAPVLLAIKDGAPSSFTSLFAFPSPTSHVYGIDSEKEPAGNELATWLEANRLPTALELNQDTFQSVMNAPHRPLVVIVAVDAQHKVILSEQTKELGKEWRAWRARGGKAVPERDVVFSWMDTEKWAKWMKSMYGIGTSDGTAVILADHQVRCPCNIDGRRKS